MCGLTDLTPWWDVPTISYDFRKSFEIVNAVHIVNSSGSPKIGPWFSALIDW